MTFLRRKDCDHILISFFIYLFISINAVLIEKILRTMPDVGKIFLLIKAKNEEAAMERLKNEVCCH